MQFRTRFTPFVIVPLSVCTCSRGGFQGTVQNAAPVTSPNAILPPAITAPAAPITGEDVPLPQGEVVLPPDCREALPLPPALAQLTLKYNWKASGAHASFNQVVSTPVVAVVRPTDPAPTIVAAAFETCGGDVSQPAYLFAIDGKTGTQKWVSTFQVKAWLSPALGDIDNDGNVETVAVGIDNKLHALDADGRSKWISTENVFDNPTGNWPTGISVGDLNLDGIPEVVAGSKVFDGRTGQLKFAAPEGTGFSIIYNTDGVPGSEIITSQGIFKGTDGSLLCNFANVIQDPAAARLNESDTLATIIGINGNSIVLYDGKTCAEKSRINKPQAGGGPFNVADFNGDGVLDFGTAGASFYMAFSTVGTLWTSAVQDVSSQVTGSTTFDFNGDGKNEIVYADEIKLRILDGVTGRLVFEAPHASYTARETPAIVDADGDGAADIVLGANSCGNGADIRGVRVFSSTDNSWVGTRKIWNQHGYDALNVKDDGGLIGIDANTIAKPWLRSTHLAGFRNNIPRFENKTICK